MKIKIFLLILYVNFANAQGSVGSDAIYEPRYLIDIPTAGNIPHKNLALDMDIYQQGGLLVGISLGLFDRVLLGISDGGQNLIGNEKPSWNPVPGFQVKVRIINETVFLPAIAFGFDSQGKETYDKSLERYAIKSFGFYAVVSKNYNFLGDLSLHGGLNYSLERADEDRDPNLFAGVEKTIGPRISVMTEYNIGWNDSHNKALGRGRGYLNFGAKFSVGRGFSLGFNIKDIFKNQNEITMGNRTMVIEYIKGL